MPKVETDFKCLRCGHDFVDMYDKVVPEERACPKCSSNSVRPLKKKKKPKARAAQAKA